MAWSAGTILFHLVLTLLRIVSVITVKNNEIDENGYIVYCPCMGRFGNQADHFLGALAFARGVNRTLVLPPWVEYRYGQSKSVQVPFKKYFQVEPLQDFHRVLPMEEFMHTVAPSVWPPDKRIVFCYMARGQTDGCNAKEGNPFGPFWDTFNVDFVGSEFYQPLHYDVHHQDMAAEWNEKYPPDKWPVLAFTGAPASFPVQEENRALHSYLLWNDDIQQQAWTFIKTKLPKGAFVGIHLRNGVDWTHACEHITHSPNLFAAPQCLGYRNEHGSATQEMCFPSEQLIVKKLKQAVKKTGAMSVFVASDNNHMISELSKALKRMGVSVHKREPSDLHVDLAILGWSNHFIGNCISSFSAFVKRERDVRKLPSSFWGFPVEKVKRSHKHDPGEF